MVIRGHFDGKVIVPEEPVELPLGRSLKFLLVESDEQESLADLVEDLDAVPFEGPWPSDRGKQVDHYLYGTPKRES